MDSQKITSEHPPGKNGGGSPTGQKYLQLHGRLLALKKYALRAGRRLTIMVNVSAVIVLASAGALGIFIARAVENGAVSAGAMQRLSSQLGSFAPVMLVEVILVGSLVAYLIVCAALALQSSHELFAKYREQTRLELNVGELGLVIADEGMWKQLTGRLERSYLFRFSGTKHYQSLERHLLFCAIHWNALEKISVGQVRYSRFKLRQGQQDFNTLNMLLMPSTLKVIGLVLVGLVFIFHGLVIYPTVLVAHGSRNIIAYARLSALAEFYLDERDYLG